jgi:flagellar hook-associated protein 3 FlgL
MGLSRVSDAQTFAFFVDRSNRIQASIHTLQQQIASGQRITTPEDDPLAAGITARLDGTLAALGQYGQSSKFGSDVLGAEDQTLGDAEQSMVRAEEIATQQASSLNTPEERAAAAEEVHGLLQSLTADGNSEFAGRRIFGGLALDAPQPFADPDTPGYTAATAYSGSTQDFSVKIGSGAGERVRITTQGDTVFQSSLQALQDLETALRTPGGDVAGTLAGLKAGRSAIDAERASVGGRQAMLLGRSTQVNGVTLQEQSARATILDADLTKVITDLTQAQTALTALFTSESQLAQTNLANLLKI